MTGTTALPPSRGLLAVDTVGFTRNPGRHQPELSAAIPALLESAFTRCGLAEVWAARCFPRGTGDGYLIGVPHEHTPYLITPLLDALQAVLEEQDRHLRARDRDLRMRLRVAVHLGSVPHTGTDQDGIGTPTNDTFRLLDSDPVRQAVKDSNPDVTLLAAIVSQRVFEDVVRAGYTGTLHPDRLDYVTAEVAEKDFAQPAWLYVPKPSRLPAAATATPPPGSPNAEAGQAAPSGTTIHGNVGTSLSGGTFGSGLTINGGDVR
ncbi:hypothetical protein [Actinomadura macrotermitis]|uniref:Guanylate cyclase domain-containing protein n=1 Tax=Actinomadura macrotermitis TaxID=2585200 RepID=A0A7K0C9N4_9ACTN|nr:hypothetical protein [Actinomadura macrotermitis]MQY09484.1 hypothetical protein [Actinomadura macrotermitis]